MVEGQSSLNIAVASALLLYEYNRVNFHSSLPAYCGKTERMRYTGDLKDIMKGVSGGKVFRDFFRHVAIRIL